MSPTNSRFSNKGTEVCFVAHLLMKAFTSLPSASVLDDSSTTFRANMDYATYAQVAAARWSAVRGAARTAAAAAASEEAVAAPLTPRPAAYAGYVERAAKAWAAASKVAQQPVPMEVGRVTGRGKMRGGVFDVRREFWGDRLERSRRLLDLRMQMKTVNDVVVACGIPEDVREMVKERGVRMVVAGNCWTGGQGAVGVEEGLRGDGAYECRARRAWEEGQGVLVGVWKERMVVDCEADVRRRYAGRPDELYRRKTSRRWSVWRRAAAARASDAERAVVDAEREMKRRRGAVADIGTSSFVGYGWDNEARVYQFCDKINGKKELRERMLRKYGTREDGAEIGPREKAEIMAQTKELFHTKVMNRFA